MWFVLWRNLVGFAVVYSAAFAPSLHLINQTQLSLPRPQNLSMTTSNTPPTFDPRFTYEARFSHEILDKRSAYINTLLALADLSTKGWISILRWEEQYSFSSYGDVTIRIHASQNPSTFQYRYAVWGLYFAIREASANDFRACVTTLYWTSRTSGRPVTLGYVSIVGGSSLSIDVRNFTDESLELAQPTRAKLPEVAATNFTLTPNSSIAVAAQKADPENLRIEMTLLGRSLAIDAVFLTIYEGIVYLAAWPQSQRVDRPGFVQDHAFRTFLRWDSSYLTIQPTLEYRYVIAALARLPVYMYERNRFEDARFVVYVDDIDVGRGWLYKLGVGRFSDAK